MIVGEGQNYADINCSNTLFDLINRDPGRLPEIITAPEEASYWIALAPSKGQSL